MRRGSKYASFDPVAPSTHIFYSRKNASSDVIGDSNSEEVNPEAELATSANSHGTAITTRGETS